MAAPVAEKKCFLAEQNVSKRIKEQMLLCDNANGSRLYRETKNAFSFPGFILRVIGKIVAANARNQCSAHSYDGKMKLRSSAAMLR